MHLRLFLAALASLALPLLAQEGASPNDQARFLAGLPVRNSALDAFAHDPQWAQHAVEMDKRWGKAEERQLAKVRSFASSHVPGSGSRDTMYYMFSGPDFLYANTIFPNASTYILCGTEPVGQVPDITKIPRASLAAALDNLRLSLKTVLEQHYFITKDMRVDLTKNNLGGTLPILYVFLARTGHTISSVQYVNSPAPGVKITFGSQTLYYFKTDLSNGGGSAGFLRWCAQQRPGMSLLKAASYLMHEESFSTVRHFLLENSRVIVQDDSGIPFRYFGQAGWELDLYGHYDDVLDTFANKLQPDLVAAYARGHNTDLGFAFGYHWQAAKGMMMVATHPVGKAAPVVEVAQKPAAQGAPKGGFHKKGQ
jgi:hypothetical protein